MVEPETLMRQAHMTAAEYFDAGIKVIDESFGKGYAKAHPDLLAAFMQTAAADFATFVTDQVTETLREAASTIAGAIAGLAHD